MLTPRRRTRRLIPLTAAGALGLTAAVVPSAAAAEVTHSIADVQGTGTATTLSGTVTVEGVVTADHRTGGYRGIYVQTAGSGGAADATPGVSDALFVFLGAKATTTTVAIGDLVRVTGTVGEFNTVTQVDASVATGLVENLGVAPTPVVPTALPDTVVGADREQYEAMLVDPTGDYLVSSTHELDRFGSVWLSAGADLPVKSTVLERPGEAANAIAASNAARRIVLDDAKSTTLNGATPQTTQPYLPTGDAVRTGDAVDFGDVPYVLGFGFNLWRLQPTTPLDATTSASSEPVFVERNARTAAPEEVGGDVTVAAFNVLNYFTTLTSQDADARGAATAEQLAAQRAKIIAAITALDADVVALQEIENSIHFGTGAPDVALADLVAGLNGADGAGTWAYVATPAALTGADAVARTDVIMNAIVYKPAAVTPVGESTTQVDEAVWDIAREPIAQRFTTPAGEDSDFLVVANHFKSKSGDGAEPADGQGKFNAERVEQANAVLALVDELQAQTGVEDAVVLGDLNSYAQEDPIVAFTSAGWTDLVAARDGAEHTYTFDGELGSLDHALATPSFAGRVTGVDVWDINADEWSGFQYTGAAAAVEAGTVYRASDHDPITVGLSATAAPVEIDLLGINDFHGRLEAGGANSPLVAGAAVLAGAVDSFRAANPSTLFFSAGDSIGASTFTSFIQDDSPTLDALNAMGLDVSALGNHEFDQGRADLDDRVLAEADFPYLGANVYDVATGEPAYDEYFVTEVEGVTVGFIGAVTEELPSLVSPAGIATLDVRPIVPEVNRVAAELSDGDAANGEADVIVLLVHEGPASAALEDSTDDSVFGQIVSGASPEIDVIYAGHTHQAHAHQIPVEGWAEGLTRPVVQASQYGENLGHVTLTVDPTTGDVVANAAELVPLTAGAPTGAGLYPADPEVAAIVADAVVVANQLGSVSLGSITGDLNRARQVNASENRGGESTLGNLVADVQLWATQELGTQLAFMNPGGLRANLTYASSGPGDPDGNVTYREAATVQPFANTLVTLDLRGDQVVDVLEEQWQPAGASRPYLKLGVAGLTYTYDPTAPAGSRITQVLVGDTPLDLTATYKVVVNSFLASGGDNFATFAAGTGRADSGRVDLQAFVDYFAALSPVGPDLAQRSVGVHVVDPPADGYAAGDTATVQLSSLLMSGGETQGTEVTLTASGTTLGTFPIDPTPVDASDEVGRATATFAIPSGVDGETLEVVATVAGTGTEARFTLPLVEVVVPTCTVEFDGIRLFRTFLGSVTVHNDSDTALNGWTLTWQYTNGERALAGIGAKVHQTGANVTATSTRLTSRVPAGGSTTFGLVGQAPQRLGEPINVSLNGLPCTTA